MEGFALCARNIMFEGGMSGARAGENGFLYSVGKYLQGTRTWWRYPGSITQFKSWRCVIVIAVEMSESKATSET